MKVDIRFEFGDQVENTLTGLAGTVVGVSVWNNGCIHIGIQPREVKDGKSVDVSWIDEQDLMLQSRPGAEMGKPSGGPQQDCPAPGR